MCKEFYFYFSVIREYIVVKKIYVLMSIYVSNLLKYEIIYVICFFLREKWIGIGMNKKMENLYVLGDIFFFLKVVFNWLGKKYIFFIYIILKWKIFIIDNIFLLWKVILW